MTTTRGRRSPLINIGKNLDKYTRSNKHYMTAKEKALMLDVAGQLMVEGEWGRNELKDVIMNIRRVCVAHSDTVLQRYADQAMRWFNEPIDEQQPDSPAWIAEQHAREQAKALGLVDDDFVGETVKVIVDNNAVRVTLEAIDLSIRATLDSPNPGGWAKIANLATIAQRLAQS
jgi:hypothetical protein